LAVAAILGLLPGRAPAAVIYWAGDQDAIWNTVNTGNSNWSTALASNTDYGQGVQAGDTVRFYMTGATNFASTTLGADTSIASLVMEATATGAVGIGGTNKLTITGTTSAISIAAGAGPLTISAPVALGAANTWTNSNTAASGTVFTVSGSIDNGGNLLTIKGPGVTTISGNITGSGGLTKVDGGALTLSGANSYTGPTTVSTACTINLGSATALGIASGSLSIISGTTLNLNGNSLAKGTISGSGGTIQNNPGGGAVSLTLSDGTFKGVVKSNGGGDITLNKVGSGELFLDRTGGGYSYTGGVNIKAGTLRVNHASTLGGTVNLGDTTGSNPATLLAAGSVTLANAIVLPTNATVGTLTVANTGTAAPTFSGGVTGSNNLTIGNGSSGTLTFSTAAINNAGTLTNAGTASGDVVISAVVGTNVTGVTQNSSTSRLILSGNNAYTTTTTITAGTLQANHANALGVGGNITFGGGTLQFGSAAAGQDWGARIKNSTAAVALDTNGQNVSVSGIDGTNASGLTKSGAGTLTLGTSAYTGTTAANGGRLDVAGAIGSNVTVAGTAGLGGEGSTSGTITFGSGSTLYFDPVSSGYLATTSTIDASAGTVTLNPTSYLLVTNAVVLNADGGITGGGNFQFTGRGTTALSGDNKQLLFTYTPASLTWKGNAANPTYWDLNTTANWDNGGSADKFYNADAVTFDDTAVGYTVAVQGASVSPSNMTFNNSANAYTVSGAIAGSGALVKNGTNSVTFSGPLSYTGGTTVNAGTLTASSTSTTTGGFTVGGGTVTLSGVCSGSGAMTLNSGSLTLSAANTYTGGTAMSGGTLNINNTAALGPVANALAISGGTIDNTSAAAITTNSYPLMINGNFTFTGTQNLNLGTGAVSLGTAVGTNRTITVTNSTATLTLGGVIANGTTANALVKAGAGKLDLGTATNTYTGSTSILGGTLAISTDAQIGGASTGTIVFDNGGKLTVSTSGTTINPNHGMSLTGNGTLEATGVNNLIYRGIATGTGAITLSMTGTGNEAQFSNAASDYSGGTVIAAGSKFVVMDSSTGSASNGDLTQGPFGTGSVTMNDVSIRSTTSGNRTVGNAITLQGNINVLTSTTPRILTLTGPITVVGVSRTITNNSGALFYLTGSIGEGSAGLGLTFAGSNSIVLSGANTYTGTTNLNGLNLQANNAAALGVGGNITFGGGTLQYTAASAGQDWTARFKSSTSAVKLDTNGQNVTLANVIDATNTAGLTKSGTGTLTLSGANLYTGTTSVTAGSLRSANAAALSTTVAVSVTNAGTALTVNFGGTADYTATQTATLLGKTTFDGTAFFGFDTTNATGAVTYGNALTMGGGLQKLGTGILVLDQTNTYAGTTQITGGVLSIASTASLPGWNTAAQYSVAANTALAVGNAVGDTDLGTILTTGTFAANASIGFDTSAGDRTYSTVLANTAAGALGLTKIGTGTLVLDQANTYTGATAIRNGALQLAGGDNRLMTTANITLGDATTSGKLILGSGGTAVNQTVAAIGLTGLGGNVVGGNSAFSTLTAGSGTIAVTLGGGGTNENQLGLTKTTTGTLILSGANTYDGPTDVQAGALRISSATALGGTAQGTVVRNNARLELSGGVTVTGEALTITGTGGTALLTGALNSRSGVNEWAGNVTIDAAGTRIGTEATATLIVSGVIGSGGQDYGLIVKLPATTATVVLSGANTYVGNTTIVGDVAAGPGTLKLDGGDNRLPTGTTLKVGLSNASGIFDLNGRNQEVAGLTVGQTSDVFANKVTNDSLTPSTLTVNAAAAPSTYSGALAGNLALTKQGGNLLTLSGTNTYSGATHVTAGTLKFSKQASLYNNTPASWTDANIVVDSGATLALRVGGAGEFVDTDVDAIKGLGTATGGFKSGSILALDTSSGGFPYGGAIANPNAGSNVLGLTKLGGNALTLSGNSTNTGATHVMAGTLALTGKLGSTSLTVDLGGTLDLSNTGASALLAAANVANNGALGVTAGAAAQQVGAVSGTGSTTVADNTSLSAASIVQDTLTIGAGGSVTIRETAGAGGASAVPEPSLLALMLAGAAGLLVRAWRRRSY
jgi:autotransporter-associated beta strand protein